MNTVLIKSFDEPQFNTREIIRYMGGGNDESVLSLVRECTKECKNLLSYNVCYSVFPIKVLEGGVSFPFADLKSKGLAKNLRCCSEAVVFAATVGIGLDRLISKYGVLSVSKSLAFQAIGAERIESLCDNFCDFIKNEYLGRKMFTRPRFSPGYGDLSIETQREIFRVLDCSRKIGLSLNESMLMSPSKSVTAIIGLSEKESGLKPVKCAQCKNTNCAFRSEN